MNDTHDLPEDRFEIGGDELLASAHTESVQVSTEAENTPAQRLSVGVLDHIRVRIGTLLKTEAVSFLFGAGASVDCGGPLMGQIPLSVERAIQREGILGARQGRISKWLTLFYLAVARSTGDECAPRTVPMDRRAILDRHALLARDEPESLRANFEQILATLHRWRSALPTAGGRLRVEVDGFPPLKVNSRELDACISYATRALARACHLPLDGKQDRLSTHKTLMRKLLTRPLNLKRVNLFTLNYDTLLEQAADAEGVVLLDGFVGTQRRTFRPESYEQDLYFPAETTEGRVHRFDRVLHLYKLHGSITWTASDPTLDDPYGVQSTAFEPSSTHPLLIYPTPTKYGETLGMPYSELFRRFASAIVRPQSVLFVIGYGFGDDHVNAIIRQALAIPSFTLVIVDPQPETDFVKTLRQQRDRRVWIAEGRTLGTLAGFVDKLLPDLRDEEIQKRVLATYRALTSNNTEQGNTSDAD